ncbi:MAG: Gfo/Idh/MocA family protein [Bacteroidota bacterium]
MRAMVILVVILISISGIAQDKKPFKIGIAGLTHAHVHWVLGRADDGDIEIVGIAEPNRELAERYLNQYNLPLTLLYPSLEQMLEKTKPEAVTAFNSIDEHLDVVKSCAPKKIHVMVEKPLAVSFDHARQMQALAKRHGIQLLTNYETTWYGSNHKTYDMLSTLGELRKIVVHDGHQGPEEIGVNKEFLEWLTDPIKNGGGAITDFGCYGANLTTWLMNGARPMSVTAITQQIKPDRYPKVDDEATIILTYPKAQAILQASWNWPYNRKDMEVYGRVGYAIADRNGIKYKAAADKPEEYIAAGALAKPFHDPFAYLAAVVRKEITVKPTDLSALQNNMIVMEILEAAKESSRRGKVIYLK